MSVLVASDLFRFYRSDADEVCALRGVTLSVRKGELVAVVGPSGSGKSTLLACLAGLDDPDGGWVAVAGQRMSHQPEAVRARLRARLIGIVLQDHNLFEHLTVEGNVAIAAHLAGARGRDSTRRALEAVGLTHRRCAWPYTLSRGEAVRAALGAALAGSPAVLLADEPTGELDADGELEIAALLRSLVRKGMAAVVATHSDRLAREADRVVRLQDGQVLDA